MDTVVDYIDQALKTDNDQALENLAKEVNMLMKQFPLYPELGVLDYQSVYER
jgi:ABC-type arginine transport system ATPase subunit